MQIAIPVGVEAAKKYIEQHLEERSREQGYPAYLEYARQCGYWVSDGSRTWHMELRGYPVYALGPEDLDFTKNDWEQIKVYHWKGDHPAYFITNQHEGNLEFNGARDMFTGTIATRGLL